MKQWICGANPQLKFTKTGMAYNLNAQNYLATQTSVFLASIYGELPVTVLLLWQYTLLNAQRAVHTLAKSREAGVAAGCRQCGAPDRGEELQTVPVLGARPDAVRCCTTSPGYCCADTRCAAGQGCRPLDRSALANSNEVMPHGSIFAQDPLDEHI